MEEIIRKIIEAAAAGWAGDQVMERTGLGKRASSILDAIIPPAAASDASAIPQELPSVPVGNPVLPDDKLIPADVVMSPEQEQMVMNRIATEVPERPRVPGRTYLPDIVMEDPRVESNRIRDNVHDFVRQNTVEDTNVKAGNSFFRVDPETLASLDRGKVEAMDVEEARAKIRAGDFMFNKLPKVNEVADQTGDDSIFDTIGSKIKDYFGNEENMVRLALGFNSMRLEPDAQLAATLGKRLELIGTRRKANRTADALRKIGTPAAIKAAEYIEATGDAKGGYKMYNQAGQFVTGSGKELMETYGITGLVPNQPYRLDTITKKVEGIGGGATNVFAVKPDKGYMLVTDETTGGVKQVPIPGGKAAEAAGLREESKEVMTDIITDAANSIRNAMSGGLFPETGTIGSLMSYLGESDAAEVRRQVGVLTSQAQVETLNAMRQQSPTGGALGSVTERELSMLSSKAGAIDPRADAKTFLAAVDDYQRTLYRIVHGKQAGDEIYEREMAKYRQSSQQPTKQTITPEQAAAELARRRGQ